MKSRWGKRMMSLFFVGSCLLYFGCATPGQPTAKVTQSSGPTIQQAQMERYDGPKARVAVGDFQVKASGATMEIGDGLREMLVTALFNADRFIVLERQAIQDVMLEQDLGTSGRVKRATAAPIGQLEGVELMIYGVVSEFQSGSSGISVGFAMSNLPLGAGGGAKNSHMAIDLRVVDTATGRILCATKIEGKATDYNAGLNTQVGGGKTTMPIGLQAYKNTPMEKAIRVCIEKAVEVIVSKTPAQYFHHQ
jgi:curli biogenesis system outer membrane secretion channel CsgG